jgi:hypothetical protein
MRGVRKFLGWSKPPSITLERVALSEAASKLTAAESDFQDLITDVHAVLLRVPNPGAASTPHTSDRN